jgi:hypothetical protein
MEGDKPAKKTFKAYPIGYAHIGVAEVRTGDDKARLLLGSRNATAVGRSAFL